jgi:hypothetical protein
VPTRIYRFQATFPPQIALTNPSHCIDDNAVARAKQRALTQFSSKSVDLSVAFAERKKTAKSLSGFATEFVRNARDIRHGRFRAVWNRLKQFGDYRLATDHWLKYRYELTPTMLDIYGAAQAIEDADNGSYARYRVTTRASTSKTCRIQNDYVWNNAGTEAGVYIPVKGGDLFRRKTSVKIRYDATLNNVPYRSLASCGVTNPLTTLWEITPWSFVVDWFVGVGSFLEGVNALAGYTWQGGTQTSYTEWDYDLKMYGSTYGTRSASGGCSVKANGSKFDRAVLGPPSSTFTFGKGLLDLTHMADALSLLPGVGKRVGLR